MIPFYFDWFKQIDSALKIGNFFKLFKEALTPEDEAMLKDHYSKLENQSIFLCSLWKIGCYRNSLNPDMMSSKY